MADFTLQDVKDVRARIADRIVTTPTLRCHLDSEIGQATGAASVTLKLELIQIGGSFKIRGALSVLSAYEDAALTRGVTAVSAGNHAVAVSFAAKSRGISAKVVMMKTANPARVEKCQSYGAEIVLAENVHQAFEVAEAISKDEGRIFIHPYEGRGTALGTATLGYEFLTQAPDVDTVIVPIGGGGLAAGVATAVRMMKPNARIFGVEPFGADSMFRSFQTNTPQAIEKVATIADSLGAPSALPYSFALCRDAIDDIVRVTDDELRSAMRLLFRDAKLAVEPAGAAATAALVGPLRGAVAGRSVGIIVCGANIDAATYAAHLTA